MILSEEGVLPTFNIIIWYNFPERFIEINQVSQKLWIFPSSILTILVKFLDIFTIISYNKSNDVSISKIMPAVFRPGIILDRLLKNYIKLQWPEKLQSKRPALKPLSWNNIITNTVFSRRKYNCAYARLFHN